MPVDDRSDRQVISYVEPAVKSELERLATQDSRALSNYVARILEQHVTEANKEG